MSFSPGKFPPRRVFGVLFLLLLWRVCAAADTVPAQLPGEVAMNKNAGRGVPLVVTVRLEDGQELPLVVDTGMPITLLDKSLAPKLSKRLSTGTIYLPLLGTKQKSGLYAAPKLFLGGTPLLTGTNVATFDFKDDSSSGHPMMGILGMDCLRHYCIQLDFEAGKVRFPGLTGADTNRPGLALPLAMTMQKQGKWKSDLPTLSSGCLVGGAGSNLLVDTGCVLDGTMNQKLFRQQVCEQKLGAEELPSPVVALFPKTVWNDGTYTNLTILSVAGGSPNLIGLGFLARHLVTLDFPNHTLYLKQTSVGPLTPEPPAPAAVIDPVHPPLPADVAINPEAGRKGYLFVTLRLASGEPLPFVVDTGSPITLLAKSLEPKLGDRIMSLTFSSPGHKQESGIYAAPRLLLDGTPLAMDSYIATYDFKQLASRCKRPVLGVLGMDCLRHYCVQLDFDAGKLRFLNPDSVNGAGLGKPFPIVMSGVGQNFPPMFANAGQNEGLPFLHHTGLAGGNLPACLIDTGDNVDGAVDQNAVKGHYLTRFAHFFFKSRGLRYSECEWDGEKYTRLIFSAEGRANRLGLRFLARHLVTLDFPDHTLYLKKTTAGPLDKKRRTAK